MFYGTTNRVTGKFDKGLNLANHIDFEYLPGRKYDTFFDPEGLISTMPAVATCLLGVFAGLLLRNQSLPDKQKVVWLIAFGIAGVLVGVVALHIPDPSPRPARSAVGGLPSDICPDDYAVNPPSIVSTSCRPATTIGN